MLRGWDINAAITQDKGNVRQAGLGANLGSLPDPKLVAMLCQQLADQSEACLILGLIGLRVFLDFHNFLMCAPNDENVGRVTMLCPIMVVFEEERLLLPGVGMCRGQQNLKCFEFVL